MSKVLRQARARLAANCVANDVLPSPPEALVIMINCYERLGQKELAEQTRQVFAANYAGDVAPVKSATKKRWWNVFSRR